MAHMGYVFYFPAFFITVLSLIGWFWKVQIKGHIFYFPVFLVVVMMCLFTTVRYQCRKRKTIKALPGWKQVGPADESAELMFHMHGWPDCGRIWDNQITHFKKSHTCVTYDMPFFNGGYEGFDWGWSFEQMTDCIALTLKEALEKNGKTSCILCVHDYGAVLGGMLQRRYPALVHKMVMFDVQLDPTVVKGKWLILFGFLYQFWLVLAFVTSSIPLVGPFIGKVMTRSMASAMGQPEFDGAEVSSQRTVAFMNYLYFHFFCNQIYLMTPRCCKYKSADSIMRSLPEGQPLLSDGRLFEGAPCLAPAIPVLFIYATELFHHQQFEKELRARPDCDVIRLVGAEVEHWFLYKAADLTCPKIDLWLRTGKKETEDYEGDVMGYD